MWNRLMDRMPGWPNERGWLTIALFIQTAAIIALITWKEDLRKDEFFKAIANAIIVTGWIGFAVGQRQNAADREQVGKALDTNNELAKSIPNAGGADITLQPGETARAADDTQS
jgi:hypothetical protein